MLSWLFFLLVAAAVVTAAFSGSMPAVTAAIGASTTQAVELTVGLAGQMMLWLGLLGVLREAGLAQSLARLLTPVMVRLFPEVPAGHPAMAAMVMNLSANVLGLNNAATPFGLKAMAELDRLNPARGTATDAMALFLVINTSGLAVLPTTVMAVRAQLGAADVASVAVPSVVATALSTAVAVVVAKALQRMWPSVPAPPGGGPGAPPAPSNAGAEEQPGTGTGTGTGVEPDRCPPVQGPDAKGSEAAMAAGSATSAAAAPGPRGMPAWAKLGAAAVAGLLVVAGAALALASGSPGSATARPLEAASSWTLPVAVLAILAAGFGRSVRVYETFVASAKEGLQVALAIAPYLVAMLVAIGMLRASGCLDGLTRLLAPFTGAVGFPAEALPMALLRPLSGSGAIAVMTETMQRVGPDSFPGYVVSLINGSSETTFYVLALYFGAAGVRSVRHTLAACVAADVLGVVIATVVAHAFYGQ